MLFRSHSKMEEPFPLEKMREKPNVYLMYDYIEEKNRDFYLGDIVDDIFDFELSEYVLRKDKWPQNRNEKLFYEWFDIEFLGVDIDPYDDVYEDSEYDGEDGEDYAIEREGENQGLDEPER